MSISTERAWAWPSLLGVSMCTSATSAARRACSAHARARPSCAGREAPFRAEARAGAGSRPRVGRRSWTGPRQPRRPCWPRPSRTRSAPWCGGPRRPGGGGGRPRSAPAGPEGRIQHLGEGVDLGRPAHLDAWVPPRARRLRIRARRCRASPGRRAPGLARTGRRRRAEPTAASEPSHLAPSRPQPPCRLRAPPSGWR